MCIFCVLCVLISHFTASKASQQNEEGILTKNISDLHFQLFSSIQKRTNLIKVKY